VNPDPGFADWSCRWYSTTSPANLLLVFDRNAPLTAADGRPITLAGRRAFVQAWDPDADICRIKVTHREYTGADATDKVELLLVAVAGAQPVDQLCQLATSLAEPAAAKLPHR
jgi:hypothetical protein